jgi:MarR family transcriptional regulator, transcriptional regulator for hemolysin
MDSTYRRETSAGYLVNWAARLLTRSLERRLLGGSAGYMPVFFALIDGEPQTQAELARVAAVEQPTMANTLSRMDRDGLVTRTPDPADKRSARVSLTPLGLEHATIAMVAATTTNTLSLGALTPEERPVFLDMLKRLIATLQADEG